MNRILTLIIAISIACAAFAQDLVGKYPDNYQGDGQYHVARVLDPLMGSLGSSTSIQLLKFEHLDAVDAIGDRGQFVLSSGVVVIPCQSPEGGLNLAVKPASFVYEYSAFDEIDCLQMIGFIAGRYSPTDEPIDPCDVVEAGSIDLPVPTGTLRIEATSSRCVFILLPAE